MLGLEVLLILAAMYFLPGIVAIARKHPSAAAIFVLNLLLGWTLLGWIVALVWSLTATHAAPTIIVQQTAAAPTAPAPIPQQTPPAAPPS